MTACVVVLGGDPPASHVARHLPLDAFVVAADRGVDHAHHLGLRIDLAVGDFDSVSADGIARLQADATPIRRFDRDKDVSDGELALEAATALGPAQLIVVCGSRLDRLDHLLVTIATLTHPLLDGVPSVSAWVGSTRVLVAQPNRSPVAWAAEPGETVTLLAVGGPANGVSTTGLAWALTDATLLPWSSWGLSNRAMGGPCQVAVAQGSVLVLLPGTRED